jgi:5-methylcytosine-specific restriction endonuclease McrA
MSSEAVFWARSYRTGHPHLRLVLLLLADGCGMDGELDYDLSKLASDAEMTESEADDAIADLVSVGAIIPSQDGCAPARLAVPQTVKAARTIYGVSPARWASLRRQAFARDGYACTYCGSNEPPLHCDHVEPFSKGGETALSNLTTACKACNVSKRARTPDQWRGA